MVLTPGSRSVKPDSFGVVRTILGSIKGHYRTLADGKHPFHRTLFGTPRTVMGHPAVHSTARLSSDVPALYGHNRNIIAAWLTLLIAAETNCPLVQTGPLSSTPPTRARPPGTSDIRNQRFWPWPDQELWLAAFSMLDVERANTL